MRTLIVTLVLAMTLPAFAKKHHDDADYHVGYLIRFDKRTTGTSCSNGDCDPVVQYFYTVSVAVEEGNSVVYVLTPGTTKKKALGAMATMGWSGVIDHRHSVLYGQLPRTKVLVRVEGDKVFVRVSDKESLYRVVSAE